MPALDYQCHQGREVTALVHYSKFITKTSIKRKLFILVYCPCTFIENICLRALLSSLIKVLTYITKIVLTILKNERRPPPWVTRLREPKKDGKNLNFSPPKGTNQLLFSWSQAESTAAGAWGTGHPLQHQERWHPGQEQVEEVAEGPF